MHTLRDVAGIPLEFQSEDLREGAIWGGITNHIKCFMLHPFEDQRVFLLKAVTFKHLKYTGENTAL